MRNLFRQLSSLRATLATTLTIAALCILPAGSASAQQIPGHMPRQVLDGTAPYVSHYSPEQKLRLALGVQPPDMAGEEALIREQQTKGSPNFHKFLTAEEWDARFAPSAEDEQKVVDWAISQGLTVTQRYANRLLVDVEAPAGVIEKAFSVTINNYQVGDEVDFSIDRDPSIPAHLSGIVSCVLGLNSIQRVHAGIQGSGSNRKGPDYMAGPVYTNLRNLSGDGDPAKAPWNKTQTQAQNQATAMGATGEVHDLSNSSAASPQDIFSSEAYNYSGLYAQGHCCNVHNDSTGSPADTSIALVTFGDFLQSDTTTFFQAYGLAWNISAYVVDGTNTPGSECNKGASGCTTPPGLDDEAPLDVEYSTAFSNSFGSSNNTAHVYVYEGANTLYSTIADIWNFIASDKHAHVVSTSYAWGEDTWSPETFITGTGAGQMHGIFNSLVGQGTTLISAAGDQGPTGDCTNADVVEWPASDPDFVAAGGTSLQMYSNDTFDYEVAWTGGNGAKDCGKNSGGGSGGQSKYFSQPYWQNGLGGTGRLLPDISLEAGFPTAQWYFCTTGCQADEAHGWSGVGGTSIVAPELAGFFAQANAYLNYIGHICGSDGTTACEPIGNPGWIIYGEAMTPTATHYPFYDIVKGCVTNYFTMSPNDAGYFCAVPGYDKATGWGSANMLQLAWAINWEVIPASGEPYITWSGPATNQWYNTNQTVNWKINDYEPSGSTPAPGIAGETQGWDSIVSDPHKEATPGSGNSFYSGPQFPNSSTGCLAFEPNGCSGGVSQGCHTAYARGWNNQGGSTEGNSSYPESYGPICYDTVAPTVTRTLSPALPSSGWYKSSVKVTLTATDPGGSGASGIAKTFYTTGAACSPTSTSGCSTYGSPFTISAQGYNLFTYFTEDKAGNFSSSSLVGVNIDETAPTTTIALTGSNIAGDWQNSVTVALTATDNTNGSGVAHTYYSLDGSAFAQFSGSFKISTAGSHTVKYNSTDIAGNSEAIHTSTFTVVVPIKTTTKLTSSLNPANYGAAVALVAVVTPASGSPASGTVTFKDGAATLGTATLASDGDAILSNLILSTGTHTLTAAYNGSGTDLTSASSTLTQTVKPIPTTITLKSSLNPANFGSSITFSATIGTSSFVVATGSVVFKDGSTTLATIPLTGSNGVTFATAALKPGTHSITAIYSGSANELTSTSAALSQVVAANKTTTTLTTDFNPAKFGYTVLLNATVKATTGAAPTGTIAFKDGTTTLATLAINAAGVATFAPSNLAVGTHSITATYTGNTDDLTSTSAVLTQKIIATTTTTTVTSSLNPATFGSKVTFKATVAAGSGPTPTGTITFKDGATALGTANLSAGTASFSSTTLAVGNHSITAVYTADTDDATSTSTALNQTISAATTTTTVASSLATATFGSPVTFTSTVKATTGPTPTGTVTFKDGTTTLGTVTLTATGSATFETSTLAVATHSITAVYKATTDDATSTSSALTETVKASATTTTLASSLNPSTHGTAVTFTATVKATTGSTPTGTVTFKDGTTTLGTGTLTSGAAKYSTTALTSASHSITAVYAGSTDDTTSTSAALTQTVH